MENKFTPGPWEIALEGDTSAFIKARDVNGAIAYLPGWTGNASAQANGYLIAAAPELLAALKELLAEAESLREYVNNYREHDGWDGFEEDSSVKQARAIIEKATK